MQQPAGTYSDDRWRQGEQHLSRHQHRRQAGPAQQQRRGQRQDDQYREQQSPLEVELCDQQPADAKG
jgi:hypothetical protein